MVAIVSAWSCIRRTIVILPSLLLICSANRFETLEECDREGKEFCLTADHVGARSDNRAEIDALIERDPKIKRDILRNLASEEELEVVTGRRRSKRSPKSTRNWGEQEKSDCTYICCSKSSNTPPFTYYKTDGTWNQIAWSEDYPQATSFRKEVCTTEESGCRNVDATKVNRRPVCVTVHKQHTLYLYKPDTRSIESKRIELPIACKCKLKKLHPFSSSGE